MKFTLWKCQFALGRKRIGEWYWHLTSGNGRIIAESEGYKRKTDAIKTIALIKSNVATAPLEER
jgi:uncharacterized protein YegP (UPF0339 family)